MKRAGLTLALAALFVNGPRLVLIFLQADGLSLPDNMEGAILAVTGIATGAVLTGGGMYIAHTLAQPAAGRLRLLLAVCWLSLLAFSVVLIAPALVSALRASELAGVLSAERSQWLWAVTAVLAVEVLAGGAMAAHAMDNDAAPRAGVPSAPSALGTLARAVAQRIEAGAPQPVMDGRVHPAALASDVSQAMDNVPAAATRATAANGASDLSKEERLAILQQLLAETPDASPSEIARQLDVSRSTVYRDLETLQQQGRIAENGTAL